MMANQIRIISFVLLFGLSSIAEAQKQVVGAIGFYNVENLFDTMDDPEINDEEFLPDGAKQWTPERYQDKLSQLSKVLATMANGADIIGLSEVENRGVIEDLIKMPQLRGHQYDIVHKDSPDRRGVDVGLIYKKNRFTVLNTTWLEYPEEGYFTRDILFCTGIYFGDTITIGVNHWPSRRSGPEKRNQAGALLRQAVDSMLSLSANAKILLMGDFNDDPRNASIKGELRAADKEKKMEPGDLFNTSADTYKLGYGSLSYRGAWNMFDQIIISEGMLQGDGISYKPNTFSVFGPDWMRQTSGQYAGSPYRSFSYDNYIGGYSDHFPVYILIER
ncbi:MAG: endonuclease/exonuclease/phosphatase family protein [Ekhidna sp.]|uniref:endonuclease/exonuclease/phosphatase family protein n=1 Tax=Ekhidna sp. TaxID=2608089 RepID=UPI0032EFE5FB